MLHGSLACATSNQSEFDKITAQAVTFSSELFHVLTLSQNSTFCSEIIEHIRSLVSRTNNAEIEREDLLYFLPIVTSASDIRYYREIHERIHITKLLRDVLFGPPPLQIVYCPDNNSLVASSSITLQQMVTRHPSTTAAGPLNQIEQELDSGGLTYVTNCLANEDTRVSHSQ